ncbi:hypothetical protein SDC9_126456 [bioreactor metagenome]|uniref:Uncharacterized protein n=1 Tax=bioreactor metagenome TaxID=1076179 RepID=A0A645CR74_9ZZZZ
MQAVFFAFGRHSGLQGKVIEAVRPEYVVIGEAARLILKRGQQGRAEMAVTTVGKSVY